MAELRCRGVGKAYGARPVLSGVDLLVPEGTLTAILGASGSGKTTLLRLIIGFIAPDEGRIEVGGAVVAEAGSQHLPPERRAVGYVAQEGALYPHLDVAGNVGFGLPRAERKAGRRIDEMLALVGLGRDYAGRLPHELSGGEQRRVALARALAPRPRLVLLDEPFSGLDAALRVETARPCSMPSPRRGAPPCSSRTTRRRRSPWGGRWRSSATGDWSKPRRHPASTPPRPTSTSPVSWARRS